MFRHVDSKKRIKRAKSFYALYKQQGESILQFCHTCADSYEQMKSDRDYWQCEVLELQKELKAARKEIKK